MESFSPEIIIYILTYLDRQSLVNFLLTSKYFSTYGFYHRENFYFHLKHVHNKYVDDYKKLYMVDRNDFERLKTIKISTSEIIEFPRHTWTFDGFLRLACENMYSFENIKYLLDDKRVNVLNIMNSVNNLVFDDVFYYFAKKSPQMIIDNKNNIAIKAAYKKFNKGVIEHLIEHFDLDLGTSIHSLCFNSVLGNNFNTLKFLLENYKGAINDSNSIIVQAFSKTVVNSEIIPLLFKDERFTPTINCLKYADGNHAKVKLLLEDGRVDPGYNNNEFVKESYENGWSEIVELLLKDHRINPTFRNDYMLRNACKKGMENIVRVLLKDSRVNAGAVNNYAIRYASKKGHSEIVKMLLSNSKVDPVEYNNYALKRAFDSGNRTTAEILLSDSRVKTTIIDDKSWHGWKMNWVKHIIY